MKKAKKILGLLLAMVMMMSVAITAMAEETYSISNSAILSSNDNYEISETINSKWDEGYVATIS